MFRLLAAEVPSPGGFINKKNVNLRTILTSQFSNFYVYQVFMCFRILTL